jgi:hypothetical protein
LKGAFAYDDFASSALLGFSDAALLHETLDIAAAADHTDRFPRDAPSDVFEITQPGETRDNAAVGEGPVETELAADCSDHAAISGGAFESAVIKDMEDEEAVDEALALSINTDMPDDAAMSDGFSAYAVGYWTYGGDPARAHDGSISFNYGNPAPV